MNLKKIIRQTIKKALSPTGYTLTQINHERATMNMALQAIAARQHPIQTVIDVGASNGQWSETLMAYYPQAHYLLIEAQPVHEKELQQFCQQYPNAQYVLAAGGAEKGEIYFDASHPLGGQAAYTPFSENNIVVPITTVDAEIAKRQLPGPYLLKLDTHGFELPILAGAQATLDQMEVLLIECYNFKIGPDCLLFHEMVDHMATLGFRCVDLVDVMYRPYDNTLWQMDMVFVRADRDEFTYLKYEA